MNACAYMCNRTKKSYVYIYIYIQRERERDGGTSVAILAQAHNYHRSQLRSCDSSLPHMLHPLPAAAGARSLQDAAAGARWCCCWCPLTHMRSQRHGPENLVSTGEPASSGRTEQPASLSALEALGPSFRPGDEEDDPQAPRILNMYIYIPIRIYTYIYIRTYIYIYIYIYISSHFGSNDSKCG